MTINRLLLCAAIAPVGACKIQIETPIKGRVTTTSTAIECDASQACVTDVADLFFDERFVAEPAQGWHFAGWRKTAEWAVWRQHSLLPTYQHQRG